MLTSITGVGNEKRKRGTDSDTVIEFTKCLINTSGIEPLGGEFSELISRAFIIEFDIANSKKKYFLETEALQKIRESRDVMLSGLFERTRHTLQLMRDGAQSRVMNLLTDTLKEHSKRRANDYIALMYLTMLAGADEGEIAKNFETLSPLFVNILRTQDMTAVNVKVESNPIVSLLKGLFTEFGSAVHADSQGFTRAGMSHIQKFTMDYHIDFTAYDLLEKVRANDLHTAFSLFAKNKGLRYPYRTPKQLAQRLGNDMAVLKDAGIEVTYQTGRGRVKEWTFRMT